MEPSIGEKVHRSRKNVWKKYEIRSRLIELQQHWMSKKTLKRHQNRLLKPSATWSKPNVCVIPNIKDVWLKLVNLKLLEGKKDFFKMSKFHGVLTSCRFKRAPRTAAFPNLWSKANESFSECSRRPHIEEQGAKTYALQKRYRMWWKMLNNFYVPSISKATFYCCKRTTESCDKNIRPKK